MDISATLASQIIGPAHVGFVVADLEEALAQAAHLYGLSASDIERPEEAAGEVLSRFAFFSVGGLQFEYIQPCSPEFRAQMLGGACGAGGINHLAWRVRDIDQCMRLMSARGIRPGYVTPGGVIAIGERRMVYLDPNTTGGLLVELIQYPESEL